MENYNDFNLPNDTEMALMRDMYNSNSFNRRTSLNNITTLVDSFLSQCYGVEKKVNNRIRTRLEETKKELEQLNQNLVLTFSYNHVKQINNATNFNLFSSLKILNQIIIELHSIEEHEDKIYYKTFAKNTINSLLKHMSNLFDALEGSFIYTFKYL